MSIGSALIGAITIILSALPFVLSARSKRKREALFLKSLSIMATKQNCKITQLDFCGEFIIGLDSDSNHLFFYRAVKGTETHSQVALATIKSSKVINESRIIESNSGKYKLTDRLLLQLVSKQKEQPDLLLTFFDVNDETQISDELKCVEKWAQLINQKLKVS